MTLTSTDQAHAGTCPQSVVRAVRTEVRRGLDWQQTAERVAGTLRGHLPDPAAILPSRLRDAVSYTHLTLPTILLV